MTQAPGEQARLAAARGRGVLTCAAHPLPAARTVGPLPEGPPFQRRRQAQRGSGSPRGASPCTHPLEREAPTWGGQSRRPAASETPCPPAPAPRLRRARKDPEF